MVAYAKARTMSWLSMLWPEIAQPIKPESVEMLNSKDILKKCHLQKKNFLEATKDGGIWFS